MVCVRGGGVEVVNTSVHGMCMLQVVVSLRAVECGYAPATTLSCKFRTLHASVIFAVARTIIALRSARGHTSSCNVIYGFT